MNIDDYFDKPALDNYRGETMRWSCTFGANISEGEHKVGLIGLPADSNNYNAGFCKAPDEVLKHLYALNVLHETIVADLGNLKSGDFHADIHYALCEVVSELFWCGMTVVIIGGSHDYTAAPLEALADEKEEVTLSDRLSNRFREFGRQIVLSGINHRNFLLHIFNLISCMTSTFSLRIFTSAMKSNSMRWLTAFSTTLDCLL